MTVPVPFTVSDEGPVMLRLFTVADTAPFTVAVPVCRLTVGPVTEPVPATVKILAPGVLSEIVLPVTAAPAMTLRLPPALRTNELPAPAPAEELARLTVAAVAVMLEEPVVFEARFAALVELTVVPPAPDASVKVFVVNVPVEVMPPALAVKLRAVPAVRLPVMAMEPAFEVMLTVGAAMLAVAPA